MIRYEVVSLEKMIVKAYIKPDKTEIPLSGYAETNKNGYLPTINGHKVSPVRRADGRWFIGSYYTPSRIDPIGDYETIEEAMINLALLID